MLILLILIVLTVALAFAPGVGVIAVVPAVLALGYLVWLGVALMSGKTPGRALRQTHPGPDLERDSTDDPNRDVGFP